MLIPLQLQEGIGDGQEETTVCVRDADEREQLYIQVPCVQHSNAVIWTSAQTPFLLAQYQRPVSALLLRLSPSSS